VGSSHSPENDRPLVVFHVSTLARCCPDTAVGFSVPHNSLGKGQICAGGRCNCYLISGAFPSIDLSNILVEWMLIPLFIELELAAVMLVTASLVLGDLQILCCPFVTAIFRDHTLALLPYVSVNELNLKFGYGGQISILPLHLQKND